MKIITVGTKHMYIPPCDAVFDAQCLDNPYHDPMLRNLTGLHDSVYVDVVQGPRFYKGLNDVMKSINVLPHTGVLVIKCYGGRHRSPALARYLHENIPLKVTEVVHLNGAVREMQRLINVYGYQDACARFEKTMWFDRDKFKGKLVG